MSLGRVSGRRIGVCSNLREIVSLRTLEALNSKVKTGVLRDLGLDLVFFAIVAQAPMNDY